MLDIWYSISREMKSVKQSYLTLNKNNEFANTAGKYEGFDSCDWMQIIDFSALDLEIRWTNSKNNRAPLPSYIKLCVLFQSHQWIRNGVTVRKFSIQLQICDILSCATLKFDRWPWNTLGRLFYATSSFMHHFIAISKYKLELPSGSKKFG